MKKIIFTLLIIHFTMLIANAQWIQQDSLTNQALLDVSFINRNTGWTSGRNGTILKTTNGGNNWINQNSGASNKSLYGLSSVNSNVIYCVGWFETILKSTNGGDNWIIIKNGLVGGGHSYWGVYFINENTGWICGSGLIIFKTTNGGLSFDSTFMPIAHARDVYFRNPIEGLVCGEGAGMCRTTDGGTSWTQIVMPVGNEAADFYKMTFIDNNIGFTQGVGNNKVYKTTTFGISWDSIARVPGADESYCIFFSSLNTGYCAGTYGRMFKTTNGGYNWRQENLLKFNTAFINSLYFYNDSIGWAVGGAGKILFTSNGGQQLVQISNNNEQIPDKFQLFQNYPNPFNPTTKIEFNIAKLSDVKIIVYDMMGREVQTLVNESLKPGTYETSFDASQFTSGVYFYRLTTEGFTETKKMILMK